MSLKVQQQVMNQWLSKNYLEQIFAYSFPHHPGLQLKKQHGPVNDLQHNN